MSGVKTRPILALILVIIMAVSVLTGCSGYALKKKEEPVALAKADKSDIFTEIPTPLDFVTTSSVGEEDDLGEAGLIFSSAFAKNDRYYTLYTNLGTSGGTYLSSFDAAGKKASKITLPESDDGMIYCAGADSDGRIYLVSSTCDKKGDIVYKLQCLGQKQKEVWSTVIKAEQDFEPLGMVTTDSVTAVLSDSRLDVFDNKKGVQKQVKLPVENLLGKICTDRKGNILLVGWPDNKLTVWTYDEEKAKFNKTKTFSGNYSYTEGVASGNGKYDFYIAVEEGVFGFVTDGSKPVRIVDFLASNQEFIEITALAMLSQESVYVLSYDDDMNSVPTLLKKMDQKAAGNLTTLTLGCLSAPYSLIQDVYKFNKKSDKYRIRIKEYSPVDYDVGALNSVIATGDVPDIICVSDEMPLESYVNKGVFEDIEPYFKGDAEISGRQYVDNILDAYRIRGGMYFVTPSFTLMGMCGRKKDLGDVKGVSVEQIEKLIKKRGMDYERALGIVNSQSILTWITDYSNDQFVDLEAGTCNFDSEEFVRLLKFAGKFPLKTRSGLLQEDNDSWVRSNRQLMGEFYLTSVESYMDTRYGIYGEEIVFTGFPGNGKSGPVIYCPYYLGICHESKNKDACWDFIRTYYLDEYQQSLSNNFPVSKSALELQFKKAMQPQYTTYTDEKGNTVTEQVENSFEINGSRIVIPLPSDDDISQVLQYIEEADKRTCVDAHISSIIKEEAGAYLNGAKSAEQTADIIQRRVKIYIKEMM